MTRGPRPVQLVRQSAGLSTAALATVSRVAWRRSRRGPLQPSWGWRYELFLEVLRSRFASSNTPIDQIRSSIDRAGRLEQRRKRVDWRWVDAGGQPALWALPRPPRSDNVVLYLHGGGYGFGSPRSHMTLIASLALSLRLTLTLRLCPSSTLRLAD